MRGQSELTAHAQQAMATANRRRGALGLAYASGAIATGAIISLIQDMMGRERTLEMVRESWVDAAYTVPIALLMLLVASGLYSAAGRRL